MFKYILAIFASMALASSALAYSPILPSTQMPNDKGAWNFGIVTPVTSTNKVGYTFKCNITPSGAATSTVNECLYGQGIVSGNWANITSGGDTAIFDLGIDITGLTGNVTTALTGVQGHFYIDSTNNGRTLGSGLSVFKAHFENTSTASAGALNFYDIVVPSASAGTISNTRGFHFPDMSSLNSTMPIRNAFLNEDPGAAIVSASATYLSRGIINRGTKFTASGCSNSTTVGGATAGKFTSGTTGTCTVVITIAGATGMTADNGWSCAVSNQTTANLIRQTASTTTTATLEGVTATNDIISFNCQGY